MSESVIYQFNNITRDLLSDMREIVGLSYYIKFNLITKINNTLPIKKFKLNVLKFKKYILEKNPEYFLNENIIKNELNNINDEDKEYYLNEYNYLRNIFLQIDDKSRDNLWDILIALTYLCENYHK